MDFAGVTRPDEGGGLVMMKGMIMIMIMQAGKV
jgi:hypothetical protein